MAASLGAVSHGGGCNPNGLGRATHRASLHCPRSDIASCTAEPKYYKPRQITAEIVAELHQLSPFDPDHMPEEILLTEAFHRRFPDLPQVACSTRLFTMTCRAWPRFADPAPLRSAGVRRYGFHGLSYEFLMGELARLAGTEAAQGRVILAHLGNGASLAAVRHGKIHRHQHEFYSYRRVPMSTRPAISILDCSGIYHAPRR